MGNSVNYVKTSNKLIGEIENNDLYASDDGCDGFNMAADRKRALEIEDEDFRGCQIDFGTSVPEVGQ